MLNFPRLEEFAFSLTNEINDLSHLSGNVILIQERINRLIR